MYIYYEMFTEQVFFLKYFNLMSKIRVLLKHDYLFSELFIFQLHF